MNRPLSLVFDRWIVLGVFLVAIVVAQGCRQKPKDDLVAISTNIESKTVASDSIQEAFRDVPRMILFERRVATAEIARQLNSWAVRQTKNADWVPSSLVATLPELIARSSWVEGLDKVEFDEPQCDYLFQCKLMRDVNQWALAQPYRDGIWAGWLEKKRGELSEDDGLKLEQTLKLFDWTIRNVWADGNAKDIEKLTLNPLLPLSDDGIGYTQLPWHTLLRGRGDFLHRARVFSQLAFQQGIPVGWLVLPGVTNDQYQLWAIAVPIGDQIYLFEPKMGIPLPGPGQEGIATWNDVRKDPAVLRRAKVVDLFDYPVSQGDLKDAFIVLDIDPMAMNRGMAGLEKVLAGENRMKLAANADVWASEFKKRDDKLQVRLWSLPWFALDYGVLMRDKLKQPSPFTMRVISRMGLYIDDTPVSRARLAHLEGNHVSKIDELAAPELYMNLRIDDESLEQLPFNEQLQASLMVRRWPNEESQDFQGRIRQYQILYRQSKLEGSLFLSMLHFDLGNFETSMSWADRWLLKVSGTEPWHACCWYQIARSLEQLGRTEEAIEMYKRSPSSQEAGNRIRARLLGK